MIWSEGILKDFIKISGSDNTGHLSLKISGEVPGCPDEEAGRIADHYADLILEEMRCAAVRAHPDFKDKKRLLKEQFYLIFKDSGFLNVVLEEIPNEYSQSYWTLDNPWFNVYTETGHFKVGWRKSVIHLQWNLSILGNLDKAEELFPNEDVTKYDNVIHCWSPEKCKEYLKTIRNCKKS